MNNDDPFHRRLCCIPPPCTILSAGNCLVRVRNINSYFNLPLLNAAYMSQWIMSALVQIMACRLFGAKPSSSPVLGYCQLIFRNKRHRIFNQNTKFLFTKMHLKKSSAKWGPFCRGGEELSSWQTIVFRQFCPWKNSNKRSALNVIIYVNHLNNNAYFHIISTKWPIKTYSQKSIDRVKCVVYNSPPEKTDNEPWRLSYRKPFSKQTTKHTNVYLH